MKMYRPHRLCPRNSKLKEPSLYRSLCVSILCMFLSTVMLVGTTMAWFSDSLQTGMYTISSANFTVTTFFCTDLADGSGTNNWQRLNPGNTTMFGGGTLSGSGSYQTAYLKIVNASDIGLKYTLSITGEPTGDGSSTPPLSLAYKEVDNEAGLNSAFTSPEENTSTGTEISFIVPKATTEGEVTTPTEKYVALKLSLNTSATGSDASSTNSEQKATPYKFSLQLKITQTHPDAQAAEPESPVIMDVNMDIIGSTPSTPAPTVSKSNAAISGDEVPQQPADENNSGTGETNPTSGPTGEAGTSESGDTGDTGPDAGTPAAGSESESESEPNPTT